MEFPAIVSEAITRLGTVYSIDSVGGQDCINSLKRSAMGQPVESLLRARKFQCESYENASCYPVERGLQAIGFGEPLIQDTR